MKPLILAFAVFVAALCNQMAHAAAPAECFANSGAVFSAHPNAAQASYIRKPDAPGRCWYADGFKTQTVYAS
jgi:Skp family chaperone for outer membrane proteins